jgi:hypothetical protein
MTVGEHPSRQRLDAQAGIAIGPILFIIAILALLAAAIAAGSGGFTAGTTDSSDRTKAAALIQIGENLKTGMDRLITENEVPFTSLDTVTADTSGNNSLFSPTGGAITPPSYSLANSPSTDGTSTGGDIWFFPQGVVPGLGTGANDIVAVLHVNQGTCNEINNRANSLVTPGANDLGDFSTNALTGAAWPTALSAHTVGCVQNNDTASSGYYFYEVLAIQ